MTSRPARLLVGSSSEGLDIARELKQMVAPSVELTIWDEGFFTPGELTLETLERKTRSFDGAVVVATTDDRVISRGVESDSVRDNLLFEFGLFVSTFGRTRALLLVEGLGDTRLPSDLFGLTCIPFSRTDPLADGLERAAQDVSAVSERLAGAVVDVSVAHRLDAVVRSFLWEFRAAVGSSDSLGLHVWVVDERANPEVLVRAARARSSPYPALRREYERSKGIVGYCWETGGPVVVDLGQEPYRSADERLWDTFGPEVRCGMDYDLLEESRGRFRAIGAAPIVSHLSSGLSFLGCLSYNVGSLAVVEDTRLRSIELESAINRTAEMVRIVLET